MNGNSVLLDTNIVLYLLSGDEVLSSLLYNRKIYISFISQLELLGYKDITVQDRDEIRTFLDECIIIDINTKIKEEVIKIRRSVRIKLPDSIILATSQYLNVPVISSDSDFGRVEEANVIYYEKE